MRSWVSFTVVFSLFGIPLPGGAQGFPPRLSQDQIREVRTAIAQMKADPRGPYSRLRWFCNDGSVLPPAGTPCTTLGGGVQHAELSELALRFNPLGFNFGTIFQATTFDALFDASRNHFRLKELVVAQHLFDVDDGWVLRQARYYRGARQIEDEERSGTELLTRLLSDTAWTTSNFLLVYQLAATIPHEGVAGAQSTTRIRNLATELGALSDQFQPLRIKIHSLPGRDDLATVQSHLTRAQPGTDIYAKLEQLRDELSRQYDPNLIRESLDRYANVLPHLRAEVSNVLSTYQTGNPRQILTALGTAAAAAREALPRTTRSTRLHAVDLIRALHDQAFVISQDLSPDLAARATRAQRIGWLAPYITMARATGFLSSREANALQAELHSLTNTPSLTAMEYRSRVAYISRALEWGMGSSRSIFGGVHQHYLSVEPKTNTFLDAMVRASVLLPLSNELTALAADADRVLGASHVLFGTPVSQGARGLNPGVALKQLELVPDDVVDVHFEPDRVYVLPHTGSELRPVAGVVTLDEGNLLSHVQLLARNLGIPNAAVLPSFVERIRPWNGRLVFYAVSPLGRVFLKDPDQLTAHERALVTTQSTVPTEKITLDVSRLRLDRNQPILLRTLRATDAGVTVGPKAANLGQLRAFFPDNVAPGVALPFGMFFDHVNRPFEGALPLDRLTAAYVEAAAMRAAGRDPSDIQRHMFAALAELRRAILGLDWLPGMRTAIIAAMNEAFDGDVAQGVFIRSDTNVEDLPQFSGAGLNLTVAHRVTTEDVLASIKQVWTSPFSERAFLWRSQILDDQSAVYPSVLLLRTVPSEKSGVMISTGLGWGGEGHLTISTAEGVGGAVDGEDTETIVVRDAGDVRLLSQAKAPYRRVPAYTGSGGMTTLPTQRPDFLLDRAEISQLIAAVDDWRRRFPDARSQVWDIEFGFVDGKLWLFQIRPFVRFGNSTLLQGLDVLDRDILRNADRPVSLRERIP